MAYTTPAEVKQALAAGGTDATGATAAAMSDADIQDSIDEAIAEIDAKLPGDPYPDPAPELVERVATNIAAYLATLTHRKNNQLPQDHPVRLRYMRARELLEGMAKGDVELPAPPAGGASTGHVENMYDGDLFVLSDLGLGPATHRRELG